MQLFRSLLFTTYMMASACVFGAVMTLGFWLPYRAQFALARTWARILFCVLEHLCGLKYSVEGRERIPPGSHVNHEQSHLGMGDHRTIPDFSAAGLGAERELLWIPFVGWGLKLLRPIAINRGEGHRAVNQVVEQGKARLADGLWVIIFPEGTRVVAGETRKFGVSGALLAVASGRSVVPLSHNAGEFLGTARFLEEARDDPRHHRRAHRIRRQGSTATQRGSEAGHRGGPGADRGVLNRAS